MSQPSQTPQTPTQNPIKRTLENAITPSPSPSRQQPQKKKNSYNLATGNQKGRPLKPPAAGILSPIQYQPPPSPPVFTPTKKLTIGKSLYTEPRLDQTAPHTTVEDVPEDGEDIEGSASENQDEVGSAAKLAFSESMTERNVEPELENEGSYTPTANPSFHGLKAKSSFSSTKEVPVYSREHRMPKKREFTKETASEIPNRVEWALQALKNAGFNNLAEFHHALYTTTFHPGSFCDTVQKEEWEVGLPRTLMDLNTHAMGKWEYSLKPYQKALTDSALDQYMKEYRDFATRKYSRRYNDTTKKQVRGSEPPYLQLNSGDVTAEFLATNVVQDLQERFEKEIPCLWALFTHMANVNKPDKRHIPTLALSMLFYANNERHQRFQMIIGAYLHASGVPTRVIEVLSQYGISVGLRCLESVMETLAKDQTARLLAHGQEMTTRQLTICYDNINIHEKKNQLRTDNKNHQYNGITGFVATAIGGRPPPTRDSICPPPGIDPSLFSMRELDSRYFEIKTECSDGIGPLHWSFSLGENASLAPNIVRTLPYDPEHDSSRTYPLQSMEAEEMSTEGTISWLLQVIRRQLGQGDNTLAKHIVLVYGDLGTVRAIHSAKAHMREEPNDLDTLLFAWPVPGLFHLRKRLLELIVKEFRGKGAPDFAHLDQMITKVNMKGFRDNKCENFRQLEDLVLLGYRSIVSACIIEYFRYQNPTLEATPEELRDHAAREMLRMGKHNTRNIVVQWVFEHLFNPRAQYLYDMKKETDPENTPLANEQLFQAAQLATISGLYIELKDSIRWGRVGKLAPLIRLLLPWFAGSPNAKNYTQELVAILIQEKSMSQDTWDSMLDNMLVRAKLKGWVEADMACEHLVRVQKDIYKARGGSFKWEKLIKHSSLISQILYDAKTAFVFGHLSKASLQKRGIHYDKSQLRDILNVTEELLRQETLNSKSVKTANVENSNLSVIGNHKLQTFDVDSVLDYLFGKGHKHYSVDKDDVLFPEMDYLGANELDPDVEGTDFPAEEEDLANIEAEEPEAQEDILEGTSQSASYLKAARTQLCRPYEA